MAVLFGSWANEGVGDELAHVPPWRVVDQASAGSAKSRRIFWPMSKAAASARALSLHLLLQLLDALLIHPPLGALGRDDGGRNK
jgi:hypothetical protein